MEAWGAVRRGDEEGARVVGSAGYVGQVADTNGSESSQRDLRHIEGLMTAAAANEVQERAQICMESNYQDCGG